MYSTCVCVCVFVCLYASVSLRLCRAACSCAPRHAMPRHTMREVERGLEGKRRGLGLRGQRSNLSRATEHH